MTFDMMMLLIEWFYDSFDCLLFLQDINLDQRVKALFILIVPVFRYMVKQKVITALIKSWSALVFTPGMTRTIYSVCRY